VKTGVLVMAYGTPSTPDAVEAYYTRIRHGRPPTPELLADLVRRYEAIGGTSRLGTNERRLKLPVFADALEQLARDALMFGSVRSMSRHCSKKRPLPSSLMA
jgi:protoheme ferro-lyase